jgi:sterol desaturase/sphingolipid hydroxylase (fatty acid hydroxylase superfamily)
LKKLVTEKKIWRFDIKTSQYHLSKPVMIFICLLSLLIWLFATPKILGIISQLSADNVRIFHMVPAISLDDESILLGTLLVLAGVARILFGVIIGFADLIFYKKITGNSFDWKGMINISLVNVLLFVIGISLVVLTPLLDSFFVYYNSLLDNIPTLFNFSGPVALIIACFIGDFCFYWSHRLCHNMRILWNLGHIYHHRHENLTQFHFSEEPHIFFLRAGQGVALMLLPLLSKVFTLDLSNIGWFLLAIMIMDIWTDPSHSVVLYYIESKSKILKSLRWVLVTAGVHYTHHSRDPAHNKKTGCNFGARLTVCDRLFGTYVEPLDYIPETGLFGAKVDYCNNPVRYIGLPYLRFYKELKRNHVKHWLPILFASTSYAPPNKAKMSH